MADAMQFDLVSPERRLASSDEAVSVQVPGAEGDMTVMAGHAPTLTILRPGVLRAEWAGSTTEYVVSGGFAEINASGVTVLAERAIPVDEMTREHLDEMIAEAQAAVETARENAADEPDVIDSAVKVLADMVAVGDHIRLSSNTPLPG
ncbi:F0F1 ATP synthase subunit epsilon [Pontibaca methylaminivorans]|uniref:ATP synthase epsilon chain n=1 Tax=Pontibaca methylaminivorans TaxID=515897 RepID=A0A1R3WJY4_9RHOB|nr:F0F1 ATP synthase subunit epsilon [Pontibaca methylaminivorans]SIT77736.1 ATP synthase F1 subcomplex epsilon subunit [Pontibaca methylaminivorans]